MIDDDEIRPFNGVRGTPQDKLAGGCAGIVIGIICFVLLIPAGDFIGHLGCWALGISDGPLASCPQWECGWFRICK